ncbi:MULTISPECIES: MotA/TolQ/ExbB proton channel family protein [Pseudoalteromonas]|uniref:MotA/TolQ/ExbB proton channel family protein n=1 Tax=Pseudoalteromonas TaxID=53246 RepID=UPI0002E71F14|nr:MULTISPECIES: MotA/TolQ/ExbB proton channel family protein [Pseudoalteromonas]MAY59437.1 MotA/TolQ/ExbB proton channel family protein [Pseudoalteromonas sp.]MDN3394282.1 MotA/TolQ/ExbB proton channel family protein [Pseudoalteromonas sp. APC 3215]MDN3400347.1 MotA/TolQ/ExbB proton channel family protein [Pseudoalteromonas sp. APC 3213]MDN3405218.1 MotA/TolQ/ExbB proton channel family protein [Pseudoalteromonas sp. APC 3218]MDN3410484.1 MotA/TolQ/ExbB proton channel family protein [Pseudoalt|tara:strand:- start:11763 stop:13130 length:1368 start_codon:yes stop_codon:yes gene_type:complete
MKLLTKMTKMAVFAASLSFVGTSIAAEPMNLDALLKTLEQGKSAQSEQNKQREQEFAARQNEQVQMLKNTQAKRNQMLSESERLETQFEENEIKLANLTDTLSKRMGSLKELFGVLQQVAGDSSNKFATSVVSAQLPGRSTFMDELAQKMGSTSKLASIEDIEKVWFELQREMTEQGKVSRFNTDVIVDGGNKVQKEVVRVGAFNLISDGQYLEYTPATNTISQLTRQPSSRFTATAADLQQANTGVVPFALDPTGGSILGLLVQAPDTSEQVHQGGAVGYVILGVGLLALLIALERFVSLMLMGGKIRRQLKDDTARDDNPLGRVMKVKDQYPNVAYDTLELKLSEAILREMPKITRNLTLIKIISVVAPLLGLLGTVTGMINTFQAITLFGTGDPKLMAGGISQALVTTVLGLVVAIPTVFLYTLLNTRSKGLLLILQEQSAGIIAERSEKGA